MADRDPAELQRDFLALRLRATAVEQARIARALAAYDLLDGLRQSFTDSAALMLDAASALSPLPSRSPR